MKETKLVPVMKNLAGKAKYMVKQKSPELLITGSVLGFIATVVLACVATKKSEEPISDARDELDKLRTYKEEYKNDEEAQKEVRQEIWKVYISTGGKLIRLYAPAIVLGGLSIAGVISANHIQRKRNMALGAAYTALDTAFREYRKRVEEKYGEDSEREIWLGTKREAIPQTGKDENGNDISENVIDNILHEKPISPYARWFDESNVCWVKDYAANLEFLQRREAEANNRLRTRGYLFLNEVYEMVGFDHSLAGQIVGWRYRKDGSGGDNYVTFGFGNHINRSGMNREERVFLLDFNVDGDIMHDPETFQSKY